MNWGEQIAKFLLIFFAVCLLGLILWRPQVLLPRRGAEKTVPAVAEVKKEEPALDVVAVRERMSETKVIDGNLCYQYQGGAEWYYTSKEGVEMVWDAALGCFKIGGKEENGELVYRNPDGKVFRLKEGKWVYHQSLTGVDWRIDPQGRYYLKEEHGRYVTEEGHVLVNTFRGWVVDDGPRVGKRRLQWGVDANGYYLKSAFRKDGYQGVVLPNGLEVRWKSNDPQTLEYLSLSVAASDVTWVPRPLGQLPTLFKTDPAEMYEKLVEEESTSGWQALIGFLDNEGNREFFKSEIYKTFGVKIYDQAAGRYKAQFLICIALTLDCYPKHLVPAFLHRIDCAQLNEWGGRAHVEEKRVEITPPKTGNSYYISYLLKSLHHEYGHNISMVPEMGFDWNGFHAINPSFQYTNAYNPQSNLDPSGSLDTANDYGRTNDREDVATTVEFCMTNPSHLPTYKSDYFKKKYAYLAQFYNARFGFRFNPDYMTSRSFQPSQMEWASVSSALGKLPDLRLE